MMKKLSEKDKTLLLIMAAVLVLGGLFMFYVKPARSDLSAAKERVDVAQSNVDTLTTQLQQLQAASSPKNAGRQNIADALRLAKAYPSSQDVPETILQLERLARQSGVTFDDGTPDSGTDIGGTTGTTFDIAVTGTYFEVQDFISRLHSQVDVDPAGRLTINGRLFAITSADLQLEGGEEGDRITSSSIVNATITAIAFSRSESAPAPAATTPTANTSTGGSTQ